MVSIRGRLMFRQYVKERRQTIGIKLSKLCLPRGLTYHVKSSWGKIDGMSLATKVVLYLMSDCPCKRATLFTDNWHISVELADNLLARNTHLVGTLRRNRLPEEVVSAKLKEGKIIGCYITISRRMPVLISFYYSPRPRLRDSNMEYP